MPHKNEEKALTHLIKRIQELGRTVLRQKGTFDLSVDGENTEVKSKEKPFQKIDFITFTEKQYNAIKNGQSFDIYIVCNVSADDPEVFRLPSDKLRTVQPKIITSYEYSRTSIQALVEKK